MQPPTSDAATDTQEQVNASPPPVLTAADALRPARGVVIGLLIGVCLWLLVLGAWWLL